MNRQAILNGFADDDRTMFARLLDSAAACAKTGQPAFSDFFDPARCGRFMRVLKSLSPELRIGVSAFGGGEGCERRMIGICPGPGACDPEFPVAALEISYNARFAGDIGHKDFLGSVLGLGIERSHVGDIFVGDGAAVVFVCSGIAGFIEMNLERVGRHAVKVRRVAPDSVNVKSRDAGTRESTLTVSSLRLDSVVAAAYHLSRSRAADLIRAERVFVNWAIINKTAENVSPGDIVTVRGVGRLRVAEILGLSKKDKIRLKIELF